MDVVWQANGAERGKGINARGAAKAVRSETTSIRLDPKLRYLSELAARKQRRSLSSFIEWAIESSLENVNIAEGSFNVAPTSIRSAADNLWDVDEPDRFVKLAIRYPDVLTYAEQVLWKLITETPGLWRGNYDNKNDWVWNVGEQDLLLDRVRLFWGQLKQIARGEAEKTRLPTWIWDRRKPKPILPPDVFDEPPDPEDDLPDE